MSSQKLTESDIEIKNKSYMLLSIKSSLPQIKQDDLDSLNKIDEPTNFIEKHFERDGFCVAYLQNKVLIGKWKGAQLLFAHGEVCKIKYLQKMRVFSENKELLIWRSSESFKARMRIDNQKGDQVNALDCLHALWGTEKVNESGGFLTLTEKRGPMLTVPFPRLEVNLNNRLMLKTRNYITRIEETGQATYSDCRFVAFFHKNRLLSLNETKK